MSTLYVRDASGFREVKSFDALERAQALLSQRFPRHDRSRLGPSREVVKSVISKGVQLSFCITTTCQANPLHRPRMRR